MAAANRELARLFERPADYHFEKTADLIARHVLEHLPEEENEVSPQLLVEAVRNALLHYEVSYWDGSGIGGMIKRLTPEVRLVSWGNQVALRFGALAKR